MAAPLVGSVLEQADLHNLPPIGGHCVAARETGKRPVSHFIRLEAGWQVAVRPANPRAEHAWMREWERCSVTDD
jgi:hypothetical protein